MEYSGQKELLMLNKMRNCKQTLSMSIEITKKIQKEQSNYITKIFGVLKQDLSEIGFSAKTDHDLSGSAVKFIMLQIPATAYKKLLIQSPDIAESIFTKFQKTLGSIVPSIEPKFYGFSNDIELQLYKKYKEAAVCISLDKYKEFVTEETINKIMQKGINTSKTIRQDVTEYFKTAIKENKHIFASANDMVNIAVVISPDDWQEAV